MEVHPSEAMLRDLIRHQIKNLFLLEAEEEQVLLDSLPAALKRTEFCFAFSQNKYYRRDGKVFFSIYHSGQYCVFLYYLAREIFTETPVQRTLADKVYFLNKVLNGIDLYYEVEMPAVFHLDHPVGTVLGRASYGDGFTFSQHCTVGNNRSVFPVIGENVTMYSGSKVLGRCHIGANVEIAANTMIKDTDIPADSIVFGSSPHLVIKPKNRS